jgi:2-isopropylmalate synthase
VVSELSGRANVVAKAGELGLTDLDATTGAKVAANVKELEAQGFSFEAAEASVALLVRRQAPDYTAPFRLLDYRVMVARHGDGRVAEATIKLLAGEHEVHTAAEGDGPVHAFDRALRKALAPHFPALRGVRLADYKVRILNSADGTAATTRVLIDWSDGAHGWSTVGAGANILDATWLALADGYEFAVSLAPAALVEASA